MNIDHDQIFDPANKRALLVLLLIVLLTLAACAAADEDEGGLENLVSEPAEDAPIVEVEPTEDTRQEIFYDSAFETDASRNPELQIVQRYEDTHPEIRISRLSLELDPEIMLTYLDQFEFTTVMAIWANDILFKTMEEDAFLDVSNLWANRDLEAAYPETFREMGARNGKQYFLPAFYSWYALYYNPDIFADYDLEPPQSWEEFLAACEALKQGGVTPLVYSGDNTNLTSVWFDYLNLRLNGPEFHAALLRGEEHYDDARVRQVFEMWQFLVESGYVEESSWGLGLTQSQQFVEDNRAAMVLMSGTDAPDILEAVRFPIIDRNLAVGEITPTIGYVIPATVAEPPQAIEFLTFLTSAETQTILTRQFGSIEGALPVHQGVEGDAFTAEMEEGLAIVQAADYITPPFYAQFDRTMTNPISRAFRNILLGKEFEAELEDLEQARQTIFEN